MKSALESAFERSTPSSSVQRQTGSVERWITTRTKKSLKSALDPALAAFNAGSQVEKRLSSEISENLDESSVGERWVSAFNAGSQDGNWLSSEILDEGSVDECYIGALNADPAFNAGSSAFNADMLQ